MTASDDRFKKMGTVSKTPVFDDKFLEQVQDNIILFDPICALLNFSQKDDSSIADVAHLWILLEFP